MNKRQKNRFKHVILLSAVLLPYALNVQNLSEVVYAKTTENVVLLNGSQIKIYSTNNLSEVPEAVLNNSDLHRFVDELVQQEKVGIITSDKNEAEGQLHFKIITKLDDYTVGKVIQGLAPDTEHYMIFPEQLLGHHTQLGKNDISDLSNHYQSLNSGVRLEHSKPLSQQLSGEYANLPDYVKNNVNPIDNYGLNITEGETEPHP